MQISENPVVPISLLSANSAGKTLPPPSQIPEIMQPAPKPKINNLQLDSLFLYDLPIRQMNEANRYMTINHFLPQRAPQHPINTDSNANLEFCPYQIPDLQTISFTEYES